MRTDHVTAWLIKQWLQENAPDLANSWNLEVDEQIKTFAARLETIFPKSGPTFATQNILAKTAIDMWNLKDVALLAGGAPTPLTPRPDQLLYYSDGNPEPVEEARAAGYNTCVINVINTASLGQLVGARSAIATGLFHFLPDDATRDVFATLDQGGFHTIAFSHMTTNSDEGGMQQYENMGIRMFMRDEDQIQALFPPGWQIDFHESSVDYVCEHAGVIGAKLADTPRVIDFYKATKQG